MPAKFCQLGWMWVAPTPVTQACADAGRSDRRLVDPRKEMRTVAIPGAGVGDIGESLHANEVRLTIATIIPMRVRTQPVYRDDSGTRSSASDALDALSRLSSPERNTRSGWAIAGG